MRLITVKWALPAILLSTGLAGCGSPGPHYGNDCTNIPGAVVGGVAGGAVGTQIGRGHGRDAAIGAGAATGAVIGSNVGC
jgi:hypothetical protein